MKKTITALLLMASVIACPALAREKTDLIWLANGDRYSGEIKQLEHGKLRLSTDSLGVVLIEWDDIVRIESDYAFQFERSDGTRVIGEIARTADQKEITVAREGEALSFAHESVVRIAPIEDTFWSRLQGSLSLGYSFTKASNVAQGNFALHATHRTEKRAFDLDSSTIITSDQENEGTQRSTLEFTMTTFRPNRWFNMYRVGFESNDELGLDLRSSIGAGLGRYLIQTNAAELALIGGLVGTSEALATDASSPAGESTQENIEGMLGVEYSHFVYDHPAVDLSAGFSAFPSITDSGRMRTQLDLNLRWEVIADLFWDLSYYKTDDNGLGSSSESTSDHGVVTSIGYSF